MAKLSEVLSELSGITDRQRIWHEVLNVLGRYTDSELTNREKLKKDDGTEVDPETIDEVIDEIKKEKVKPLEQRVTEISRLEIRDGKEKHSQKSSAKGREEGEGEASGQGDERGEGGSQGTEGRRPEGGSGAVRRAKNPAVGLRRHAKQPAAGD